jgi:hypothetical protein
LAEGAAARPGRSETAPELSRPRPHIDGIDLWLGDSVAHWEGNTLVVDVTNLDERSWLDSARHTHTDALHVIERFTPVDKDTINWEATIEDPKVFTRP